MEIDPVLWRDLAPDDVKADADLSRILMNSQEPDLSSVIKAFAHYEKEKGVKVKIPGTEATPEEVTAFRSKVSDARSDFFPVLPASAEHYTVVTEDGLDASTLSAFKNTAHELKLTQAQFAKLIEFDTKRMEGLNVSLKTSVEEGTAKLKTEWGDKFDANSELAGRAGAAIFSEEELEFFDNKGINDHPLFVKVMARIGSLMQEDPALLPKIDAPVGEEFMKQALDIMQNKSNPLNERYRRNDSEIVAQVTALFQKAKGTKPVDFT